MAQFRGVCNEETRSQADRDYEAVQEYNKELKKQRARELKLYRQWEWRGNSLPPFNIEPFREERSRLCEVMTNEDRLARKQWLDDQVLSENEPVFIPERSPRNVLRTAWAGPWDSMRIALRPYIGSNWSRTARFFVPKAVVALPLAWAMWYNVKYKPAQWDQDRGWHSYWGKSEILPGDAGWPNPPRKADSDFFDKGFKSRTSHMGANMTTPRLEQLLTPPEPQDETDAALHVIHITEYAGDC